MSMAEVVLSLKNVSTGYNGKTVVGNISFDVKEGEALAIIGQNGSGKSTLLKTIVRIISDNSGMITFKKQNLHMAATHQLQRIGISYFVQGGLIFPTLSVEEHFDLALRKKKNKEALLDEVYMRFPDLEGKNNLLAGNLSGGQKQLLSFAMLVAQDTELWLLDEPTAGLSPERVAVVIEFLKEMKKKKTMVIVEHNPKVVKSTADTILDIDKFKFDKNEN